MKDIVKYSVVISALLLAFVVIMAHGQEPVLDKFIYIPIAGKAFPSTPTPIPTSTPVPPMATVYFNTRYMNDYPACYEVKETGIGQKCRPVSNLWRLYGTFPAGTYRVVYGSPACKLMDFEKHFPAGDTYHTLSCQSPW